jgi:hypothetical protein
MGVKADVDQPILIMPPERRRLDHIALTDVPRSID